MANKILITGAAGFIGRKLSDSLEKVGKSVVQVDNLSETPLIEPKPELLVKDVQNITSEEIRDYQIDTIVHLAAKKNVKDSFYNLDNSVENYEMTIKLFNAALNSNVKNFFLASTCEIFGFQKNDLNEDSLFKPHSPYAVSKVANEYLANVYMMLKNDLKITSLNFFNTYGPTEGLDAVIPNFINKAIENKNIVIEGDGKQARDFTYIDDTVDLLIKIIDSNKYFRSINIGSGQKTTIIQIIDTLKEFFPNLSIEHTQARPNEIKYFVADNSLIRQNFLFNPRVKIEDGISKVIEFHKLK